MFSRTIFILNKIKQRKLSWLYNRIILEFRIPETTLGKKLKPFTLTIAKILMLIQAPFRQFASKKCFPRNTLYFFYDLELAPITFNFCEALALANVRRIELGLQFMYIVFVPGPKAGFRQEMIEYEAIIDSKARDWRKYNILFPITHLIPSCIGFINCSSREEAAFIHQQAHLNIYPKDYSVTFPSNFSFAEGAQNVSKNMMPFKATHQALRYIEQWLNTIAHGRKIITITLRQYSYMPERNSNITAWANFARQLDKNEYCLVIVPDTESGMDNPNIEMKDFIHFNEACWNVELRIALYEKAYLNLGINNGPFVLCWLNHDCRYLMFKIVTPTVPQTTETALNEAGHILGKTPAFANPWQKWVWEEDTEQTINREFIAMCKVIDNQTRNI